MDISNMDVNDKVIALQSVIGKVLLDADYASQCVLGEDKMGTVARMNCVLEYSRQLFIEGKISKFSEQKQKEILEDCNNRLDDCLTKFPEYNLDAKGRTK
jgi:hypothetical protein